MNIGGGLRGLIAGTLVLAAGAVNSFAESSYNLIKNYGLPMLAKSYVDATYSNSDIKSSIAKKPGHTLSEKRAVFEKDYARDYERILDVINESKDWNASKAGVRAKIIEEIKKEDGCINWDSKRIADSLDRLNTVRYNLLKKMHDSKTDLNGAEGYLFLVGDAFKDKNERGELLREYGNALKAYDDAKTSSINVPIPFAERIAAGRLEKLRTPEIATNGHILGLIRNDDKARVN